MAEKPKKKVLVVDSNEQVAVVMDMALESLGYKSYVAHNEDDMELELAAEEFDLVMLDLFLNPGRREKTFAIIENHNQDRPVKMKIIFMSAMGFGEAFKDVKAKADVCLEKPYGLAELEATLKKIFGNH